MSPTHTMSAHLCKQIVSSWRESRQGRHSSPEASPLPSPPNNMTSSYFPRSLSPKSSMDNGDRSDTTAPLSRTTSNSNWRWGSR
ncbi:hypothetical protein QBC40DRAFT_24832 [Triangularia verruculosa]|uniref:Uncharacterized protein n=1 Tax=Triangularia verruculosa TaxID=2587418 RepID=A0AAN6X6N2_9PEZI|nr:hypothetical protein QBC40DRAFT_24832 [Triangularia verruculosa]